MKPLVETKFPPIKIPTHAPTIPPWCCIGDMYFDTGAICEAPAFGVSVTRYRPWRVAQAVGRGVLWGYRFSPIAAARPRWCWQTPRPHAVAQAIPPTIPPWCWASSKARPPQHNAGDAMRGKVVCRFGRGLEATRKKVGEQMKTGEQMGEQNRGFHHSS